MDRLKLLGIGLVILIFCLIFPVDECKAETTVVYPSKIVEYKDGRDGSSSKDVTNNSTGIISYSYPFWSTDGIFYFDISLPPNIKVISSTFNIYAELNDSEDAYDGVYFLGERIDLRTKGWFSTSAGLSNFNGGSTSINVRVDVFVPKKIYT